MKILYAFAVVAALSGLYPISTRAQELPVESSVSVYISEINWAGSNASLADEWIELFNPTNSQVDVSGWVLTGIATGGEAIALTDDVIIAPQETLLLANYDHEHENTTLAVAPDLITSSLSLSNSGLDIQLVDTDGNVVDSVSFTENELPGSSDPYISTTRLHDGSWTLSATSQNLRASEQLGSPGAHDTDEPLVSIELISPIQDPSDQTEQMYEELADALTACELQLEEMRTSSSDQYDYAEEGDQTLDTTESASTEIHQDDVTTERSTDEEMVIEEYIEASTPAVAKADELFLSEIYSNPASGDEWVEILSIADDIRSLDG